MNYLIFSFAVMALAAYTIIKTRKHNVQKALKIPKDTSAVESTAQETASRLGDFLVARSEISGVYLHKGNDNETVPFNTVLRVVQGKDDGVLTLIRLAERLGCEVVIREKETTEV